MMVSLIILAYNYNPGFGINAIVLFLLYAFVGDSKYCDGRAKFFFYFSCMQ